MAYEMMICLARLLVVCVSCFENVGGRRDVERGMEDDGDDLATHRTRFTRRSPSGDSLSSSLMAQEDDVLYLDEEFLYREEFPYREEHPSNATYAFRTN
jgi:hypothetical protein